MKLARICQLACNNCQQAGKGAARAHNHVRHGPGKQGHAHLQSFHTFGKVLSLQRACLYGASWSTPSLRRNTTGRVWQTESRVCSHLLPLLLSDLVDCLDGKNGGCHREQEREEDERSCCLHSMDIACTSPICCTACCPLLLIIRR